MTELNTKIVSKSAADAMPKESYITSLGYSIKEVEVIKANVAKGVTDVELAYFLGVCKQHELNPFTKEVRCYKDHKGNMLVIVGRDGMLAKAQKNPLFLSLNSIEVCTNDEFEFDLPNETVRHTMVGKDRGAIIGAYAILKTSDGAKTMQWADIKTYDKNQFTWNSHKAEMIKKVAEMLVLKKKFKFSGLVCEGTYTEKGETSSSGVVSGTVDLGDFSDKFDI